MILVDASIWIDYFNGHTTAETDRLAFTIAELLGVAKTKQVTNPCHIVILR